MDDRMFDGLPDLLLLVRRDGVLVGHTGGSAVEALRPRADGGGHKLDAHWPKPAAEFIRRLVRQAIASRNVVDATLTLDARTYEVRVCAQGPDRALCMIRQPAAPPDETEEGTGRFEVAAPQAERRRFMRRFKESMAEASLRERPTSVAVVNVEGIAELARLMDARVGERVMAIALARLAAHELATPSEKLPWYSGQLNDHVLVIVIDSRDRDQVEHLVTTVCASLREPVELNSATFHLLPFAGVAILGRDAASPKVLLHHAWAAAAEARRAGTGQVSFFSDTVRLRTLARLDIADELRDAVDHGKITLRYWARRELASGALVAAVGYLHWQHPLRGAISPVEFLAVAEATGIAATLSRNVLAGLRPNGLELCVSFGPLRHHILHEGFLDDVAGVLAGGLSPRQLELRIGERSLAACDPARLQALAGLGVRLIVDDVGGGSGSFDLLARAPLAALQFDGAVIQRLPDDPMAVKIVRAGIGFARAIGLTTIARGVERQAQHEFLLSVGCDQGIGEYYGDLAVAAGFTADTSPASKAPHLPRRATAHGA